MAEKIPYLKRDYSRALAMRKEWLLFDGAKGCTLVDIEGVGLRMSKLPRPLPGQLVTPSPASEQAASPPEAAAPAKRPAEPKAAPQTKEEKRREKARALPDFDLMDISEAMRAEGFTNGAKFSERWFNGRAYSAYVKRLNGSGMVEGRYDSDMVDTGTIKMSWLLGYRKIKDRYEDLLLRCVNDKAIVILKAKLSKFFDQKPDTSGLLDTKSYCKGDLQDLHSQFQFQFSDVSMVDGLVDVKNETAGKYAQYLGMSDVSAALGNFNFYAAVARAEVNRSIYNRYNTLQGTLNCRHHKVTVTHIYVYARDSYSFHDARKASQYLGHWNKKGLIIDPESLAVHLAMMQTEPGSLLDQKIEVDRASRYPVDIGVKLAGGNVYYPVRNRDYQLWRAKHNRGGDFLVYSDLRVIKLAKPIFLDMGEVCRPKN